MKIPFKYIPVKLDKRGFYHPNTMVDIPQLKGNAVIYDENNYLVKTPNTVYNFGFIDVINPAVESTVREIITTLGVTAGMKEITIAEAKQMLIDNGYIETNGTFEIVPAGTNDITGEATEAITLTL